MNIICVIIPAYEPNKELIKLVNNLIKLDIKKIILVDDGSSIKFKIIFDKLTNLPEVKLITHEINSGKGVALKSAFKELQLSDCNDVIVTSDSDGQHLAKDILSVANSITSSKSCALGFRKFTGKVPIRSAFGNYIARNIFKIASGSDILDTQTGLRAFSKDLLPMLVDVPGKRYEYETEMLMRLIKDEIPIKEIPIETVYIDENKSSHFNPFVDLLKIYSVFLRYILISALSFLIDISSFHIQIQIGFDVFTATYTSRILSGCINFFLNKNYAFRSKSSNHGKKAFKYVVLVLLISTCSAFLVDFFVADDALGATKVKIMVDISLFFVSFITQRFFVFK